MVNVGGRSKGCSTCRRRHVKCDETRPVCNRCKFQNLPCDGPREITFVQGTIVKSRRRTPKPKTPDVTVVKPEHNQDVVAYKPTYALRGDPLEQYICYGRRYFKPGAPLDVLTEKLQLHDLNMAVSGKARGGTFDQAILSFATVVFGFEHKQSCIMQQGYTIHGTALQSLSSVLQKPDCAEHDDVLLAVVALTMLESVVPTSRRSYLQHVIGLDNLLALRDPDAHASSWSLLIYRSIRHFMLFGALRAGRPSVFALPQWKRVLRIGCDKNELLEQELWDILADCTVLNADYELAESPSSKQQALVLLSALSSWRSRWDATAGSSNIDPTLRPMQKPGNAESSLSDIQKSIDLATKLILYNTILLHVLQIVRRVAPFQPEDNQFSGISPEDISSSDPCGKEIQAASEICHCISHLSAGRPLLTSNVSPVAQWGVSIAWETLKNQGSAEALWLGDLIRSKRKNVLAKGLFDD